MTVLKLYNRNGNDYPLLTSEYRFSDLIKEFFNEDNHRNSQYKKVPEANFQEEKEAYILLLALPGVNKENLKIEIVKDQLTVSGSSERTESDESFLRKEFDFSNFERIFRIPGTVDSQKIKADSRDGILRIELPKKYEAIDRGAKEIKIS